MSQRPSTERPDELKRGRLLGVRDLLVQIEALRAELAALRALHDLLAKLPVGYMLIRQGAGWSLSDTPGLVVYFGDTPEAALRAALMQEEESK